MLDQRRRRWASMNTTLGKRITFTELLRRTGSDVNRWGTGMIVSSSTFCPHSGRVIRDLFRQLHAVWHGTEALVYSNHPREVAASSYLAIIFGRIASGIPWFLRSTVVLM